jgi:hypothetical protein
MTSDGSIVVARMQMKKNLSHLLLYLASAYPVQQLTPTVRIVVITHTRAVLMKYWAKLALSHAAL